MNVMVVDGLPLNRDEFLYVLKFYHYNKKDFKVYKNDNVALLEYIRKLVREYREVNGI